MTDALDPNSKAGGSHYRDLGVVCDCGRTIEPAQIMEELPGNLALAIKYLCRCDLKDTPEENLKKALYFVNREIRRRARKKALDTCSSVH